MALAALLAVAYGTRWEEAATLGRTSAQFRTPQATVPPLPVPGASANLSKVPIPVVGPAHILAVDGHELTVSSRKGVLHPVPKTFSEPGHIQPRADPPPRVVRRDSVGQSGKVCN